METSLCSPSSSSPQRWSGGQAHGGAIYAGSGTAPKVKNCLITANTARGGAGGADSACDGEPGGDAYGGGVYVAGYDNLRIENCRIVDSLPIGGSGGEDEMAIGAGDGGGACGGGLYFNSSGELTITNCFVVGNGATGGFADDSGFCGGDPGEAHGAGIYCESDGNSKFTNCCVVENVGVGGRGTYGAHAYGGGIDCRGSGSEEIANCTVAGNTATGGWGHTRNADDYGSGIYSCSGSTTIIDCVLWDNDANDVDGGGYSVTYSCTEQIVSGTGNTHDDPCFVSGPQGDYYLSQVAAGQALDSPCVDAGSDTAVRLGMDQCTTRTDGAGDEGIVDMGYHYGNCGPAAMAGDIDGDGDVDGDDYALFAADWYCREPNMMAKGTAMVDGDLSEWNQDVGWMPLDKVYHLHPNDVNQAGFALMWDPDANKVYAAVVVADTNQVFLDEYISWNASDRLEIYSQGDAEGGSGWIGTYDLAQQYYVAPNTAAGHWATWALGETLDANVGLEYAVTVDGQWIIYEAGVKMFDNYGGFSGDTIVTNLTSGHTVGFDLVVCTRWGVDGFGMLSANTIGIKSNNADNFARYTLIDESAGPFCDEPACDLDGNGLCNFADLRILVDQWLAGK